MNPIKQESSMDTKEIGNLGEKIAQKYLRDRGYRILDENFHFRIPGSPQRAEIDIVAKKDDIVSFIEVKTLHNAEWSRIISPEEKVDFFKRKKIVKAAEFWLIKNKMSLDSKWDLRVLSIRLDDVSGKAKIRYLKNLSLY